MDMTPEQKAAYIAGMESDDRKAMIYGGLGLLLTFLVIWLCYAGMQRDIRRNVANTPAGCDYQITDGVWGPQEHLVCK